MAINYNDIPFVQAEHYTETSGRTVNLIVIHSMEAPEKGATAEAVARYFAKGTVRASAHYCIDNNSIVQCVQTKDVAYGAPLANRNGVHIELAGYARQTREQWLDQFSRLMLINAARLCRKVLCPKLKILPVYLDYRKLKKARHSPTTKGFTTHAQVSKAFRPGGHWDPGPGFPMNDFLSWVKKDPETQEELIVDVDNLP